MNNNLMCLCLFSSFFFYPTYASQTIIGSWKFMSCMENSVASYDEDSLSSKNRVHREKSNNVVLTFTFEPDGSFTSFTKTDLFKKEREKIIEYFKHRCVGREGTWGVWTEERLAKVCEDPKTYYEKNDLYRIRELNMHGQYFIQENKIELFDIIIKTQEFNVEKVKDMDFYYSIKGGDFLYVTRIVKNGVVSQNPEENYCDQGYIFSKQP